jgi:nucleoside-diphosphate-sugar epimerase
VRRIVFASSIQAMIGLNEGRAPDPPYALPYFPLDGAAPAKPAHNYYGLSKEFGERLLSLLVERFGDLCATALRFPLLAGDWWLQRFRSPLPSSQLNLAEGLSYLELPDAARVVALAIERHVPGYHQYFPAQELPLVGLTTAGVIARFYSGTALKRPREQIENLIDGSALVRDLGFAPSPAVQVTLQDL